MRLLLLGAFLGAVGADGTRVHDAVYAPLMRHLVLYYLLPQFLEVVKLRRVSRAAGRVVTEAVLDGGLHEAVPTLKCALLEHFKLDLFDFLFACSGSVRADHSLGNTEQFFLE